MNEPGKIKFLLNQQEISLDFHQDQELSPTVTLLQYLRLNPQLTGTKEGCAEGDCGACTVVLLEMKADGSLVCKAIDSCLVFLPMLHLKAVITVEALGTLTQPHAVQTAMVDEDGSQCGYCTPGFIMSLYALYQNHEAPNDEVIKDALTGNLCRCTGYRAIMDAARAAKDTHPSISDPLMQWYKDRLSQWQDHSVSIVGEHQKYFRPVTINQTLELKSMYPQALFVNGATDLALKVTKNDEVLPELIDLSAIEELKVYDTEGQQTEFGAGLSLEEVKNLCKDQFPALFQTLVVFGSLQIRNLATLGGNIGSASPIGDTLPTLMAYEAQVNLTSHEETRSLPLREFITGYRQTALKPNELITSVTLPQNHDAHIRWYKISKRKDLDISTVSGGFRLKLDPDGVVKDIKLYYGGVAAMTKAAHKAQDYLLDKPWQKSEIEQAQKLIDEDFTPISDARAFAESRKIMARNLLLKFWTETSDQLS